MVILHSADIQLFLYFMKSNSGPPDVTCAMLRDILPHTFRCVHLTACPINSCVAVYKPILCNVLRTTDLPYQTILGGALFRLLHKHVQQ